jgi:hypothetical protein
MDGEQVPVWHSNTIGFDRKPEAMENCASQSLRPLKGPNTTKQLKKGACR